jgi:hypothetical protein
MIKRSDELQEVLSEIRDRRLTVSAPAGPDARLRAAMRSRRIAFYIKWVAPVAAAVLVLVLLSPRREAKHPVRAEAASYIELPSSAGLPASSAIIILRVQLRRGDLRQFGLDISPPSASELISADFAVGEDGLARAVRFVQ